MSSTSPATSECLLFRAWALRDHRALRREADAGRNHRDEGGHLLADFPRLCLVVEARKGDRKGLLRLRDAELDSGASGLLDQRAVPGRLAVDTRDRVCERIGLGAWQRRGNGRRYRRGRWRLRRRWKQRWGGAASSRNSPADQKREERQRAAPRHADQNGRAHLRTPVTLL